MPTYQSSAQVAAPVEAVWSVLADVQRWDQWTPTVSSVEPLDGASVSVGRRFRVNQPKLRPAVWVVTEVQAPTHFTWESGRPGMTLVAEHMLRPLSAGQTEVVLKFHFRGLLGVIFGHLSRGLVQSYLSTEAISLCNYVESRRSQG